MKRIKIFWLRTKISYYEQMTSFKQRELATNQINSVQFESCCLFYKSQIRLLTEKLKLYERD